MGGKAFRERRPSENACGKTHARLGRRNYTETSKRVVDARSERVRPLNSEPNQLTRSVYPLGTARKLSYLLGSKSHESTPKAFTKLLPTVPVKEVWASVSLGGEAGARRPSISWHSNPGARADLL